MISLKEELAHYKPTLEFDKIEEDILKENIQDLIDIIISSKNANE